jgi:hypothetical protein
LHVEGARRRQGEIDDAAFHMRTAVGDLHPHGPAIAEIGHPDHGSESQTGMRGGEIAMVELLPPGRYFAVMGASVKGGQARLGKEWCRCRALRRYRLRRSR